ncbi:MAG TPA: hypothetical protein PKY82_00885 [Pyrinomonadaceae bacterium]|nr:hypothetical protein [Pyrinomonadaceae bacterium]
MSEIGQQLGFYEELYEQAELIDNVLLEIKINSELDNKSYISELGQMLVDLGKDEWQTTPARLFIILLKDFSRSKRKEWSKVGENLIARKFDADTVTKLETLADILEQEQTNVMARVKGL